MTLSVPAPGWFLFSTWNKYKQQTFDRSWHVNKQKGPSSIQYPMKEQLHVVFSIDFQ